MKGKVEERREAPQTQPLTSSHAAFFITWGFYQQESDATVNFTVARDRSVSGICATYQDLRRSCAQRRLQKRWFTVLQCRGNSASDRLLDSFPSSRHTPPQLVEEVEQDRNAVAGFLLLL
jgi:hypothetical protein